jgi:hypothetical protein
VEQEQDRAVTALTAAEAAGRLAVHAWAALEQGQTGEAMRLLGEITEVTSHAIEQAGLDETQAAQVRRGARQLVNPRIGWAPIDAGSTAPPPNAA